LRNLPFHDTTQNRIWLEICALAADLIGWTQRLALTGWARIANRNGYGCACSTPQADWCAPHTVPC
jgi:hypothetical protein